MILEDLEKICLILYKNDSNLSDYWLLIIDSKIKANQAKYDLDRLTAKISALSSGKLSKYEYLTGEDLGYRPSVLEQKKFDYSPLGKVFSKGLDDKNDKKEGILRRLKNIENNQNANNNDKNKKMTTVN